MRHDLLWTKRGTAMVTLRIVPRDLERWEADEPARYLPQPWTPRPGTLTSILRHLFPRPSRSLGFVSTPKPSLSQGLLSPKISAMESSPLHPSFSPLTPLNNLT